MLEERGIKGPFSFGWKEGCLASAHFWPLDSPATGAWLGQEETCQSRGTIKDSVIHVVSEHLLNTYYVPGAMPGSEYAVGTKWVLASPRKEATNTEQINPQIWDHSGPYCPKL